jgi:hypothetical protein
MISIYGISCYSVICLLRDVLYKWGDCPGRVGLTPETLGPFGVGMSLVHPETRASG